MVERFNDFEVKVLEILVNEKLTFKELSEVVQNAEFVGYEYTGSGYFLTFKHPILPVARQVCSEPIVTGKVDNIQCGFVVFLENKEITIECHSWGEIDVPEDFRKRSVEIKIADKQLLNNL